MRNIYLFFILFIVSISFAQKDEVKGSILINYTHSLQLEGMPNKTEVNAILIANQNHAAYEMDFLNNSNFIDEEDGDQGVILSIRPEKNPIIYKYLKENKVVSKERIMSKFYLVLDEHYKMFNWTLKNNYKDILGYNCQEAITSYRGRQYKAYFTTDIPFTTGPWKFGGLPGLILRVESVDGVFTMDANKIEIKNIKSIIENPFENSMNKTMSWDDYISIYVDKYNELLHYTDENGGTRSIPKKNIETFIRD